MISLLLLALASSALIFWAGWSFFHFTQPVPRYGGSYSEGIVGQPAYINPLLSQTSEADADLVQLIYSALFKYDGQGRITGDLAEKYEVSEDQKTYTVYLKKNIKWHDGEPLNAEDIVFTFNTLVNAAYKSPLRYNFQGVEASQIDEFTVGFNLKTPYFGFLDNLTLGILPKHIWENAAPENFPLADNNIEPVGSGPYQFFDYQKDSAGNILTYELKSFPEYFGGKPYISRLTFNFYSDEDLMVAAFNKKEILGMSNLAPEKVSQIKSLKTVNLNRIGIPRYFSFFLNKNKSAVLADKNVGRALSLATNREAIVEKVLHKEGIPIYSPILPQMDIYSDDFEKREFNLEEAKKILEESGWKKGEDGLRAKNGVKLRLELLTTDWPELSETADLLREQWKEAGIETEVKVLSVSDLQQNYIRPREYDALLFGQAINLNPDLYPFWHSSQKRDPGFNLALFDEDKADELLADSREELDAGKRKNNYAEIQKIIADEIPAVFLYSPNYLYPVNKKVKGIDIKNVNAPSYRFNGAAQWYVKTKRVKK